MIIAKQPKVGFSGFCDLVPPDQQAKQEKTSQEKMTLCGNNLTEANKENKIRYEDKQNQEKNKASTKTEGGGEILG